MQVIFLAFSLSVVYGMGNGTVGLFTSLASMTENFEEIGSMYKKWMIPIQLSIILHKKQGKAARYLTCNKILFIS